MSEIQEAAKSYIQNGFSAFPVKAKDNPGPWREYMSRIMPEDEVPVRFNGSEMCAIAGGPVSGNLVDLDIDDPDSREPLINMIKARHPDILDRLVFTKTPNGFGILFRSESLVIGNRKIARGWLKVDGPGPHTWKGRPTQYTGKMSDGEFFISPTKLETKSEGGYFLIHPSPGYEILSGSLEGLKPISDLDTNSILAIAKLFHEGPEILDSTTKSVDYEERKKIPYPGDVYASKVDCGPILKRNGWAIITKCPGGKSHWGRPGASSKRIGGTLYPDNSFMVFTSNAAPLVEEKQYTSFALLTIFEFQSDFSASTKSVAEEGYVPDMTIEEVHSVLKDNPNELDSAYKRSGLTEAEVSGIATSLGLAIPAGKHPDRVEICYDKTELNRVVEEMDHAVSNIAGKWGYYKFMTLLGFVNKDNSFQMYKKSNFEQRCEQSFYMTSYVTRGKKAAIENIRVPPHCVEMLMDYPDTSAEEIRGFASHPTLLNGKIIGLQDGFEEGIMFQDCDQFEIDSRSFKECYNRLIELFCIDMLFPDPELGPALFVSMLMTAVARLGLDGGCPGYLITANSPGTGKSTLFEIVSRVVYGKLVPSVRWKESSEEMSKELVSYLRRGKECMLYDNIKQKKAIDNEDLAQLITAGCFEGRLLGLSEEITVDARAMFVFIGNDIKVATELARRIMTVQLRAEKDNPERRPVQIKRVAEYCDTHRVEAVGCILKMLQEGTRMADKLEHTSGLEFWDRVVRNPIVSETGIDVSGGFDISATQSEENQSVKSIVCLLAGVFGIGHVFYTKDVYLAIADYLRPEEQSAAEQIRALKDDECGALRDALIDVNQRAAMNSQSTGNALKSLSDYQISGDLKFVRHITKSNQPRKHWIVYAE